MCYEVFQKKIHDILPLAVSLELLHNFTLIHDDIQDGHAMRRGRPSLWVLWGKSHAINAGDGIHTLAHLVLFDLWQNGFDKNKVLRVIKTVLSAELNLSEGQCLDLDSTEKNYPPIEDYIHIAELKTASLIECSLYTAAILGSEDEDIVQPIKMFGRHIGIAFQIFDDFLDIAHDVKPKQTSEQVMVTALNNEITERKNGDSFCPKGNPSLKQSPSNCRGDVVKGKEQELYVHLAETHTRIGLQYLAQSKLKRILYKRFEELSLSLLKRNP
ncbi:MAG: polyprenyl synthetase family protein [Nitrospinae bacterium]|nr:polyprenyl synthetase family protein [Nitrospinota bacterium]